MQNQPESRDRNEMRCECCRHKRGWWTLCVSELFHRFRTNAEQGLSHCEELDSRRRCGPNEPRTIPAEPDVWIAHASSLLHGTRLAIFFGLGTAWLGSKGLRSMPFQRGMLPWTSALAGLSAVSFYVSSCLRRKLSEYHALREHLMAHPPASTSIRVTREGKTFAVKGTNLVPGDIVHLECGQRVPADCRVVESKNLEVDLSFLPRSYGRVHAVTAAPEPESAPLEGARCSIFASAHVTRGSGRAMVTRVGDLACPALVLDSLRCVTIDSILLLMCVDAAWLATPFPITWFDAVPRLVSGWVRGAHAGRPSHRLGA